MWRPFCLGAGCGIWHVAPMSRWFSPKSWPPENHLDMIANLPPYHSPKRGEITVRDDKCNGPWLPPSAGEEGYESKRCMNAHLPQNPLLLGSHLGLNCNVPVLGGPPLLPLGLGVGAGGVGVCSCPGRCCLVCGSGSGFLSGALGNKVAQCPFAPPPPREHIRTARSSPKRGKWKQKQRGKWRNSDEDKVPK